jgi:aquaporin Z
MPRNLPAYLSEFAGTGIMLFIGVSAVAFMWGPGSPVPIIHNDALRRLVTGSLFAGGATLVVYSPLGQRSGAHVNPAVTLAFWRIGKVPTPDALAYVVAQVLGAIAGAFLAGRAFHGLVADVQYAATLPGETYGTTWALVGETVITFLLVFTIFLCVNKPRIASRTGLIAGALVAVLVMIEAPVSGTSLNPARSLAPAILVPNYTSLWVYFVGPALGALIAVRTYQGGRSSTVCAKLFHTAKYPCPFQCGYRLVSAGETILREGDMGDEAYVIERGTATVRRAGASGPVTIGQLGPGDWVGEMSLLLDEPRSATVIAVTDAQLRRVTRDDFGHVLSNDPKRTQELLRQLARHVREMNARISGGA